MDTYSGYNQIPKDKYDINMTTFMIEGANNLYNCIRNMLEVYMDDMQQYNMHLNL